MDTSMTQEDPSSLSLQDYISQYQGLQKFVRLLSIIENANIANLSEKEFIDMVEFGYKLAYEEKCLGVYKKI